MNIQEYVDFLRFIKENNSIKSSFNGKCGRLIKYVESSFDTRDDTVWSVNLRQYGDKDGTEFMLQTDNDIKNMYEWLKGE